MKRNSLIAVGALAALFAFSSCKKDYTCTCNIALNPMVAQLAGINFSFDTTTVYKFDNLKKKEAEAKCDGIETALTQTVSGVFTGTCSLEKQ